MAEILLFGLLVIIVSVAWISIMVAGAPAKPSNEPVTHSYKKLIDCYVVGTPHKWSYNAQDKLQCTACGVVAGEYTTEGGGY